MNSQRLVVGAMKTEYAHNPQGIEALEPRLFWQLESEQKSALQTAYQVMVATTKERLMQDAADMWDSGKIWSNNSVHILYAGKSLEAETDYYWKVRVWDAQDQASEWSESACWSMGLLTQEAWQGDWIGRKQIPDIQMQPSPYMRKAFKAKRSVRRAMAYTTALGLYELHMNGQRLGDWFAPGWTDYNTRVQYQTYDVTELLLEGDNAVGAIVGDGWFAGTVGMMGTGIYGEQPYFLLQLNIEYEDGSIQSVVTDSSWRTSIGPIQYSDFIKGEAYDARLELTGWDMPGYDDTSWGAPDLKSDYAGKIVASVEPSIRIMKTIKPVDMKKTAAGTYIYDMGQNMVGWTEVTVQGEQGTKVTLSHAEMLNPDGTLYLENLRKAIQQNHYILKGEGHERYEPHFTFQGFRYVELIGYSGEPNLETVIGKVVHSDTPQTGSLETSDQMVNQLYSNITWGQRGNFLSVPTDCPQRDERLGWTGDAQIFARTASYNMDVSRFFSKYMIDMTDAQMENGAFPDVAPDAGWFKWKQNDRLKWYAPDNAGWGDAGIVIPWTLYLMYGDIRVLDTHYDAMVRWVEYLKLNSTDLVRPAYANYGDWLSIEADTPNEVLATAYFAYSAQLLGRIAGLLGRQEDSGRFKTLFQDVAQAFCKAFVDEDGRIYGNTQTVYVLALQFGLLTDELRSKSVLHLVRDIEQRGNRLSTGFLGVGYLLPALTTEDQLDVAYSLLTQEAFPSWMYSIKHGATTIWERWDGWTEEKGFQTPSMNSFNHYSLGSVGEWMFRFMGGIEADPEQPGFKHTIIRPRPGGQLTSVKVQYESLYGIIKSEWQLRADGVFQLDIQVPVNTTASVYVPGINVLVDGSTARLGMIGGGCELVTSKEGVSVFHVGSGAYRFEANS